MATKKQVEPVKDTKKVLKKETVKVMKKVSGKTVGPKPKFHDLSMETLLEMGAHFGHQSRRWNPKMEKYLWRNQKGVSVFDLEKTVVAVDKACEALSKAFKEEKRIIFLGTKRQAKEAIEKVGAETGVAYVSERWLGGTITNWEQMSKRIKRMIKMEEDKASGAWDKYTKKEQLLMDREVAKLRKMFGGISKLTNSAEVLFVVDVRKERTAVREAARKGALIIGIVDSNANPDMIDIVIPMNDDSHQAVSAVIEALGKVLKVNKKPTKS